VSLNLQEFAKVEMNSMLSNLAFNNIIRMVTGKCYYGDGAEDDPEAKRVRQLIAEAMSCFGAGHAADHLPMLRWITDFERRVKKIAARLDEFFQRLVDEKRVAKEKKENTMIDHLLSLQVSQPEYYTDHTIKGTMLVSNPLRAFKLMVTFGLFRVCVQCAVSYTCGD